MNDSIEAIGVSNKVALKEAGKYLIPPFIRPLITIVIIVFLCQSIYEAINASPIMSFFFLFLALISYMVYLHSLSSIVNQYMGVMKRYMHIENTIYRINFSENHIFLTFTDIGECINIPYSNIVEVIETKNLYLMKTKTYISVIVTKDSLKNLPDDDWKNFLIKKCITARKIKFKKQRKKGLL
jgi:hypothetical protein